MDNRTFSAMSPGDKSRFIESKKHLLSLISWCLSAIVGGEISTLGFGTRSGKQRYVAFICCCLIICGAFVPCFCKSAKAHIQLVNELKQKYK